ncbi:MAG: hypothetical protein GX567_04695 [Clostridia bacterium]|nr:hypothetical protein [Clostridia bacterium]
MMSKRKRKRMYRRLRRIVRAMKEASYELAYTGLPFQLFEPGTRMVEISGIFLVAVLVFNLISSSTVSYVLCWIAAIIFLVLLLLLKLEQIQDAQRYEEWQRRNFGANQGEQYY